MNINNILSKQFIDLTEDDQKQVVNVLLNRMMSEFKGTDRQGIYSVTQKLIHEYCDIQF